MKLITELNEDVEYVTEEKGGEKKLYITGVFLQSNIKNRNGRIYPPHVMEREVERYTRDYVRENRAYGELGHPEKPGVNLHLASHIIRSLERNGDDYVGKAEILMTPNGRIAETIIKAGGKLGVSSRGMGTLKEDRKLGANVVQDDFHLAVGADIVADPSAPSAFVRGILEGVEFNLDPETQAWRVEKVDELHRKTRKLGRKALDENAVRVFHAYVELLRGGLK